MQAYLIRIYAIIGLCFYAALLPAQTFGGNPPNRKWLQINTDTARIIFPDGMEASAKRAVAVIHQLQKTYASSIGNQIRKTSIVLQPSSIISNGYVGLAPWRSEWYTTAPQNAFQSGAFNWVDNLAVHEFRHVQQYSNFNKGVSKLASFFLGEEGQALFNAMAVPDWFFEGDAVQMETQYTEQGRGRLPLFMNDYRSLFDAGRKFSYMQLRNGSLRRYIPDHYSLGYLLVAYGRKQYGDMIWKNITANAAAFKSILYPFQSALKKYTGVTFKQFVKDAQAFYQQQWKPINPVATQWLTPKSEAGIYDYKYPYLSADGSLIVLKSSSTHIPAFYQIIGGKERKIHARGITDDDYFSYNNGKIIYTLFQPDTRWGNQEFHSLHVLDIATGQTQKIVDRVRLFSPDIAHDGRQWVAILLNEQGKSALVHGYVNQPGMDTLALSEEVLSYPKFSKNDDEIFVISRKANGSMAMLGYTKDGQKKEWIPYANRVIGFPQVQGDTITFSSSARNTDAIHALSLTTGKEFSIADYSTGLYQGYLQGTQLVASAFTAYGYRLGKFDAAWTPIDSSDTLTMMYQTGVEKGAHFFDHLDSRNDSIQPYRKTTRLLNIHSWRPFYEAPEYSFTLYGQNVLNTLSSEIAYIYNEREQSHKIGYTGIYGASFLQPVWGLYRNWNRTAQLSSGTKVHWNEWEAFGGLRLPLRYVSGKWNKNLVVQATVHTEQINWTGVGKQYFADFNKQYAHLQMTYTTALQRAPQHIFPKWGASLTMRYKRLFSRAREYQLFSGVSIYLPGIGLNHHIVLNGSYQSRDTLPGYSFSDEFPFSRGYDAVNFPRMGKIGVNYHFPVAYPDWGFAQLVYFRRVRGNLFFDHTITRSLRTGNRFHFNTIGGECYFDTRWWNQHPVTFGLRYSYLINPQPSGGGNKTTWEIILPVALF